MKHNQPTQAEQHSFLIFNIIFLLTALCKIVLQNIQIKSECFIVFMLLLIKVCFFLIYDQSFFLIYDYLTLIYPLYKG